MTITWRCDLRICWLFVCWISSGMYVSLSCYLFSPCMIRLFDSRCDDDGPHLSLHINSYYLTLFVVIAVHLQFNCIRIGFISFSVHSRVMKISCICLMLFLLFFTVSINFIADSKRIENSCSWEWSGVSSDSKQIYYFVSQWLHYKTNYTRT